MEMRMQEKEKGEKKLWMYARQFVPKEEKMKKIDAHTHIGEYGGIFNVKVSGNELLALMEEFDVEKAICCSLPNRLVADLVRKHPDRVIGAVWVNPHEGKKAVDEVKRAVDDWGFEGIKLHPLFHAFLPNDRAVYPIMEEAQRRSIPVFIHSGHPPFSLPWSIGELAENFPDVTIVMIHMGHGHGVYIQAAIDTAKRCDNIILETSGMPMHTKIKEAYEEVGETRIVYGSDIPFHHPSVEIQRVMVSGLNETQLQRVFYDNIAEILKA
jgi:predicted TIM-barrel fold metal-dependent hydrolase